MRTLRFFSISILALAAAFLAGYTWRQWRGAQPAAPGGTQPQASGRYFCPMHPTYTADSPTDCPICGMRLVPAEGAGGEPAVELPPGVFHIPVERQQLIGVRYGTAEITSGVRTIRAVGKVELDETKIARIHPKVEGWIEEVYVNFPGRFVARGEALFRLYSPELLATQREFLLALEARRRLHPDSALAPAQHGVRTFGGGGEAERRELSENLIAAARRRLELWDVDPQQIEALERTEQPQRSLTVRSPISGYVLDRNVFPGRRVTPETELYTIADLGRVWVMADLYESEVSAVRPGAPAMVSLAYQPGRRWPARIDYVQPSLDPVTRTMKVRLELPNPDLNLKPGMFVDVEFHIPQPPRLTVPVDAVLDSGLSKTVFVDRGNGHLEARQVETGELLDDRIIILRGLAAGERIVTSGTFLIDSESRLQQAVRGMAGHPHGAMAGQVAAPEERPHDRTAH